MDILTRAFTDENAFFKNNNNNNNDQNSNENSYGPQVKKSKITRNCSDNLHNVKNSDAKPEGSGYSNQCNDTDSGFHSVNSSPNSAFPNSVSSNLSSENNKLGSNNNTNSLNNNNNNLPSSLSYIDEDDLLNDDNVFFDGSRKNSFFGTSDSPSSSNHHKQNDLELELFSELGQHNPFLNNNNYNSIEPFDIVLDTMNDVLTSDANKHNNTCTSFGNFTPASNNSSIGFTPSISTCALSLQKDQKQPQQCQPQQQQQSFSMQAPSSEHTVQQASSSGLAVARVAPMWVFNNKPTDADKSMPLVEKNKKSYEDTGTNEGDKTTATTPTTTTFLCKNFKSTTDLPLLTPPTPTSEPLKYQPPKKPLTPYMRFSKLVSTFLQFFYKINGYF